MLPSKLIVFVSAAAAWRTVSSGSEFVLYMVIAGVVVLIASAVGGPVAGVAFDLYVRWWEARLDRFRPLYDAEGLTVGPRTRYQF